MINIFQLTYDVRLKDWHDLRTRLKTADTETKCIEIDAWWQKAPLVNHHLHPQDLASWPDPWQLLSENTYCVLARGLGMYYTLALTGVQGIDFLLGIDDNNEEVALVSVANAKYLLNYYPNTVISNNLHDFKITSKVVLTDIIKRLM